jgi:hypothetical protein
MYNSVIESYEFLFIFVSRKEEALFKLYRRSEVGGFRFGEEDWYETSFERSWYTIMHHQEIA